jgi:hypothetical protein
LHPLQATTFITSHFGSTQESFCLWSSARLLITRRFSDFQYDGRPIKKIDCIRTVQVIGDLYVCWCWFLRKGKIVRVLDVRLCLCVIWVAGSSLHYSWLEALTHTEEDSAGIQVYVIVLKEYKDVLYSKQ